MKTLAESDVGSQLKGEGSIQTPSPDFVETVARTVGGITKRSDNQPVSDNGGSLIENYINGDLRLHFHLIAVKQSALAEHATARNYCVVLECPPLAHLMLDFGGISERWKGKLECLQRTAGQMDRAVLVEVREFTQMSQWALEALPCRERLERFNQNCGLIADPSQHLESASIVFRGINEDGELGSAFLGPPSASSMVHKLEDRMVECRTEVVDDLPDDDAPHGGTWFFHDHSDGEVFDDRGCKVPRYSAELDPRFVRISIKEGSHFSIERVELLIGPLQFHSNSKEGIGHDALQLFGMA